MQIFKTLHADRQCACHYRNTEAAIEQSLAFFLLFSYNSISHLLRSMVMAYKISDACINCGACENECPVTAISEASGARVIDADTCISCGACAGVCPTDAISEG